MPGCWSWPPICASSTNRRTSSGRSRWRLEQHLDGQVAAEVGVAALEHGAHAAPGDLAEDLVAGDDQRGLGRLASQSSSGAVSASPASGRSGGRPVASGLAAGIRDSLPGARPGPGPPPRASSSTSCAAGRRTGGVHGPSLTRGQSRPAGGAFLPLSFFRTRLLTLMTARTVMPYCRATSAATDSGGASPPGVSGTPVLPPQGLADLPIALGDGGPHPRQGLLERLLLEQLFQLAVQLGPGRLLVEASQDSVSPLPRPRRAAAAGRSGRGGWPCGASGGSRLPRAC